MPNKKTKAELEAYIEAQNELILELREKVDELKNSQNSQEKSSNLVKTATDEDVDREICRLQLNKLYNKANNRELSIEETKKVEIFTKLLLSLDSRPKKNPNELSGVSNDELLADVLSINDNTKQ